MNKSNLKLEYENNPSKNYIVTYLDSIDNIVDYEVEMINNNPTSGALNIEIRQFNDRIKILYDATGRIPIKEYLKGRTIKKNEFITILKNMAVCLLECKNYFLDEKKFFMDLGTILINEKDLSVNLLYLPFEMNSEENINNTYRNIVKSLIIDFVSIEEKTSGNIIQETLKYLRRDDFSLVGFKKYLEDAEGNKVNVVSHIENKQERFFEGREGSVKSNTQDSPIDSSNFNEMGRSNSLNSIDNKTTDAASNMNSVQNNKIEKLKKNKEYIKNSIAMHIAITQIVAALIIGIEVLFISDLIVKIPAIVAVVTIDVVIIIYLLFKSGNKGETASQKRKANTTLIGKDKSVKKSKPSKREIVTEMSFETELLDAKTAFLMSKKAGTVERIFISKDCFKIGRLSGAVDYISDNKAIGKLHAEIRKQADKYYVLDLNSKNGTFVNGQRINSDELYEIRNSDTIVFANSEFKFVIE